MSIRRGRLHAIAGLAAALAASCQTEAAIRFAGQEAPIEVRRDTLGVPHVYGRTDADAAYGAGYMQAVDRLFEMDVIRRRALGRAAEIYGPTRVDEDQLIRVIDIPRWGRETLALIRREQPRDALLIDAWVAGVNRRIAEVTSGQIPRPYGFGPDEFDYLPEPYTAEHAMAVSRLIEFANGQEIEYDTLATLVRSFFPDIFATGLVATTYTDATVVPQDELPAAAATSPLVSTQPTGTGAKQRPPASAPRSLVRGLEELRPTASNNWAVAAEHSANGRSVIAGDPHQGLQTPNVFWAHHMNSREQEGALDVIGFGFVGTPGIQLGHNDRVAWTATVAYPDTTDLYEVYPPTDGSIWIDDRLVELVTRQETIDVRGAPSTTITVEEVPGFGVILPTDTFPIPLVEAPDRVLLQWAGFRPARDPSAFLAFDRSQSVEEFDRALDSLEQGSFNWIFADAHEIAYRVAMLVPRRTNVSDANPPYALMDGRSGNPFWPGGFLTRDEMPHSRGATQGWLASSNNDPFGFLHDGKLDGDPYYYGSFFDPGTRAARANAELARLVASGPVTSDAMKALQLDTVSVFAQRLVPLLQAAHAQVDADDALAAFRNRPDLDELVAALATWDYRYERTASAPVIVDAWMGFLAKRVIRDDLGVLFDAINAADVPTVMRFTALIVERQLPAADSLMQEGRDVLVMQALADTSAWLTTRYGSSSPAAYTWGDAHGVLLRPLTDLPEYALAWTPSDGGIGTLNVANTTFLDMKGDPRARLDASSGAVYRMVATFDADGTPRAEVVFPPGNSGDPGDVHFDDALSDWVEGVYHPLPFRRADVEAATESSFVLEVLP